MTKAALRLILFATMLSSTAHAVSWKGLCERLLGGKDSTGRELTLTPPVRHLITVHGTSAAAKKNVEVITLSAAMRERIQPVITKNRNSISVTEQKEIIDFIFSDLFFNQIAPVILGAAYNDVDRGDLANKLWLGSKLSISIKELRATYEGTFAREAGADNLVIQMQSFGHKALKTLLSFEKAEVDANGFLKVAIDNRWHKVDLSKQAPAAVEKFRNMVARLSQSTHKQKFVEDILSYAWSESTIEAAKFDISISRHSVAVEPLKPVFIEMMSTLGIIDKQNSPSGLAGAHLADLETMTPDKLENVVRKLVVKLEAIENDVNSVDYEWLRKVKIYHDAVKSELQRAKRRDELRKISNDVTSLISNLEESEAAALKVDSQFGIEFKKLELIGDHAKKMSGVESPDSRNWKSLEHHVSVLLSTYSSVQAVLLGHISLYTTLQNNLRGIRLTVDQMIAACTLVNISGSCAELSQLQQSIQTSPSNPLLPTPTDDRLTPVKD